MILNLLEKLLHFFAILTSDCCYLQDMPAAEGAVAAAAVADQMYGPKEDRKLTIVLVIFIHLQMFIYLVVTTHLSCR